MSYQQKDVTYIYEYYLNFINGRIGSKYFAIYQPYDLALVYFFLIYFEQQMFTLKVNSGISSKGSPVI